MHQLLPDTVAIDINAADPAARVEWQKVPAKMAVYLLTAPEDGTQKPVLLATVGNLRAALQRRLTDLPPEQKTKRIAYGQICTQVHFCIMHSPLLAQYTYRQVARELFPERYRQMLGWRPAWWVSINLNEEYPRLRRTQELALDDAFYCGPIPERTAAGRLIEMTEDLFELCRYHEILRQAPNGKACAYKEMGKCPAPCDGSIPMSQYHRQLADAAAFLSPQGRAAWHSAMQNDMRNAAAQLQFEKAGQIKNRMARADIITQEPYRLMQELREFKYFSLQPGKGRPWVAPLLICGSEIRVLEPIQRKQLSAVAPQLFEECQKACARAITQADAEVIGLITRHLCRGEEDAGVYLRLNEVQSAEDILRAAEMLAAKKNVRPLADRASDDAAPEEPQQ